MKGDGIDPTATQQLIERQVQAGVGGVVVGGTGEHGALSLDERRELARIVADARWPPALPRPDWPLATRDAVRLSQDAQQIGAAGMLVPAPYGEEVNWREKQAYYEESTSRSASDHALQHVHSRSDDPRADRRLAELSNVSAIKQSSGDGQRSATSWRGRRPTTSLVYIGWDDLTRSCRVGRRPRGLARRGERGSGADREGTQPLLSPGSGPRELEAAWGRLRPFLRFIGQSENYVSVVKLGAQLRGLDVGDVRRPYLMPAKPLSVKRLSRSCVKLYIKKKKKKKKKKI